MAKKEPDTVIVAIHGGKPEDYSEMSDGDFEALALGTFGTYHLTNVSFAVYCEWLYNVKEATVQHSHMAEMGDGTFVEVVEAFTAKRSDPAILEPTPYENPPPFHYIGPADTWQGVSLQLRLSGWPFWTYKDSDGHNIELRRFITQVFFHRAKFYFLMDNEEEHYLGEEFVSSYTATKEKLEVIITGFGSFDGFVYRKTWINKETYYPP